MTIATKTPTKIASPHLSNAIFQLSPKATKVENITIGLIIGPVNINAIAAYRGTLFFTSLSVIGTIPHSQAGKSAPIPVPTAIDKKRFFGITLAIISSVMNICINADINTPITIKGSASITILIKIVFICNKD